jgi:hypothetical protein
MPQETLFPVRGSVAWLAAGLGAACGVFDGENPRTLTRTNTGDPTGSGAVLMSADAGLSDPSHPNGDGINTTGQGAGSGAVTGLPCDVQQLLENTCIGCHLGPTPPKLLTYDDLLAPSSDPTKTLASACLDRVRSTTSPMPPPPAMPATPDEIAVMAAWVAAGTPRGTACTVEPDGGAPATTNPYATPSICTSNTTAGGGEGSRMAPGRPCITCHTQEGGPRFTVAGTVYPTAHEPNNCNGSPGNLTVIVTDANGVITNVAVNAAGNFDSSAKIAPPFHVKVFGQEERGRFFARRRDWLALSRARARVSNRELVRRYLRRAAGPCSMPSGSCANHRRMPRTSATWSMCTRVGCMRVIMPGHVGERCSE